MKDYLTQLNPEQQKAAQHINGPLMVIAGAGSGKTRVITSRIAYLIENNISPFNILALTFTNKAAKEMRNRIERINSSFQVNSLWMGTFHSMFAKILRFEANRFNYPSNFTIYDTDFKGGSMGNSVLLVEEICSHIGLINNSKTILEGSISNIKEKYYDNSYEIITAPNNELAASSLFTIKSKQKNKYIVTLEKDNENHKDFLKAIISKTNIVSFKKKTPSIEDIFIKTVSNE